MTHIVAAAAWFLIMTTHNIPTTQHQEFAFGPFETEQECQYDSNHEMSNIENQIILKLNAEIDTVYGCMTQPEAIIFMENLHKPKHDEDDF